MVIVETAVFTRQVKALLPDMFYRDLQNALITRPEAGSVIPGSGGLRKLRWQYGGRGKRGGMRVIYYWAVEQQRILMLFMYPKNARDDLSPAQLKVLRQVVEAEFR